MRNVCGTAGMLLDRARTKCMSRLKKLCLQEECVQRGCTSSGITECVYMGQGTAGWGAVLWKNMLGLLCNVNSFGTLESGLESLLLTDNHGHR